MHARLTAVTCEFAHLRFVAFALGQPFDKFVDDVAQPMGLLLARKLVSRY